MTISLPYKILGSPWCLAGTNFISQLPKTYSVCTFPFISPITYQAAEASLFLQSTEIFSFQLSCRWMTWGISGTGTACLHQWQRGSGNLFPWQFSHNERMWENKARSVTKWCKVIRGKVCALPNISPADSSPEACEQLLNHDSIQHIRGIIIA